MIRHTATRFVALACTLVALLFSTVSAAEWKFLHAHDGDTPTLVRENGDQIKIRVRYVDTPEANQPGCAGAKAFTERMLQGYTVHVLGYKPSHDRLQAALTADNVDLGRMLVRHGWAWVDPRYSKDASLFALQEKAKEERMGVWATADPVPPWEWRKTRGWNGKCSE